MLRQDFLEDFKGERKSFHAEYIPYFEKNYLALECYVTHLAWREEMRLGLKPSMTSYMFYDKRTFDPMKEFEKTRYARFIKEYNENGKLYYY